MTDYGTMQNRIADELARSDLTTNIREAIQTAIAYYKNQPLWFNEHAATTTTSSSLEIYALPDDLIEPQRLTVQVSNDEYPLNQRTWEWFVDRRRNSSTFLSYPTDWVLYRNQIYLYPTPNGAYPMSMYFVREIGTLTVSADTNAWMTDGEELIRSRAKNELALHVLQDDELATRMAIAERRGLDNLLRKSGQRRSTGRVRANQF